MTRHNFIRCGYGQISLIWILFALFNPSTGYGQSEKKTKWDGLTKFSGDSIHAEFPGGLDVFRNYIMTHARYPLTPQLKGISSVKVVSQFVVDTSGRITRPEILSNTDKDYNQEVLRVLSTSPVWRPGSIKGKKTKIRYKQVVRFKFWKKNVAGADVLLHGTLLKRRDIPKKTAGLFLPVRAYDPNFAKAIFGPRYRPLVIVDDVATIPAAYDLKGFKKTLRRLEGIDTSKFDLFIDGNVYPFYEWKKRLHADSTAAIAVNDKKRSANPEILGSVGLITRAYAEKRLEKVNKAKADKEEFYTYLQQYRAGEVSLRNELIYVDDNYYNSQAIGQGLDTSVIRRVSFTAAEVAEQKFKDSRRNGYFQLQSKWYHSSRNKMDLEKLVDLLRVYQGTGEVKENYIIYLNNTEQIDFQQLSLMPETTIRKVVIISVEEAKAFFGQDQQCPIIYITMM